MIESSFLLLSLGTFLASDTVHSNIAARQAKLMHHALITPWNLSDQSRKRIAMRRLSYSTNNIWQYLRTQSTTDPNPCTWRGVACTDGVMTSFAFIWVSPLYRRQNGSADTGGEWHLPKWEIDIRWLPSTLQSLHLVWISLQEGWAAELLPRDLRYVYFKYCLHAAGANANHEINLRKLPRKLEEFYLAGGWYRGAVHLDELPPTLRVCVISCARISLIHAVAERFPKTIEKVHVQGCKKAKVVPSARIDDKRFSTKIDYEDFKSPLTEKFNALEERYLREFDGTELFFVNVSQ